jgi:hypothetical protein
MDEIIEEKQLELVVPVTDSEGTDVEIHIMNLKEPEKIKGMPVPCCSFLELRYANDHKQAYGNPEFFDGKLTMEQMVAIGDAYKYEIDKHRF